MIIVGMAVVVSGSLSWWQGAASQVKAKLALQVFEVRKLTIRAV